MRPMIDHIHITVGDLDRAEVFYDKLLPMLGFDISLKEYDTVPEHEYKIVEYHNHRLSIELVNQRPAYAKETPNRRKAGALHHLAFHADSPEKVDPLYAQIKEIPAVIVHEPKYYPENCPDYYAFFFKDSRGDRIRDRQFRPGKVFPGEIDSSPGCSRCC